MTNKTENNQGSQICTGWVGISTPNTPLTYTTEQLKGLIQNKASLPTNAKSLYENLPGAIKTILLLSEGWLVGSSIDQIFLGMAPSDYDVAVSDFNKFMVTTAHIRDWNVEINTLGGIKANKNGLFLDIWPQDLDSFFKNALHWKHAYNLKRQILIQNVQ